MTTRETVVLTRDCEAVVVPAGTRVLIPEGTEVTITQTLGGTFSIVTDRGFMARIEAHDADALGKEPPGPVAPPAADAPAGPEEVERRVWEVLRSVYDPEIPVNVVDLGLIYDCRVVTLAEGRYRVEIDMTMTAPGCGMGDVLRDDAMRMVQGIPGVLDARVEIVWEPPWTQSRMSDAARLMLGMD